VGPLGSSPIYSEARAPMRRNSLVTTRGIVRTKVLFMKAVYSRFNEVESIDAPSFSVAQKWLQAQEYAGEIWAVGIYDDDTKVLHVVDSNPETLGGDEHYKQVIADCNAKGIDVLKIEFYTVNVGKD
jgi:hypothetical protein